MKDHSTLHVYYSINVITAKTRTKWERGKNNKTEHRTKYNIRKAKK